MADLDDINRITLRYLNSSLARQADALFGANGKDWFCWRCRTPINSMWCLDRFILYCDCPPAPIRSPLIYESDMEVLQGVMR